MRQYKQIIFEKIFDFNEKHIFGVKLTKVGCSKLKHNSLYLHIKITNYVNGNINWTLFLFKFSIIQRDFFSNFEF